MADTPPVQYCTTDDGVTIAYAVSGAGPPLLCLPPPPSHLVLDWRFDEALDRYRWLGARFTIARLDRRNTGLSQRGVEDLNYLADIEAVVRKLGWSTFTMVAIGPSTQSAIQYAATHSGAVERLVLWNAYVSASDVSDARVDSLVKLAGGDWEMFTETYGALVGGWQAGEISRQYAALIRESITQEDMKHVIAVDMDKDVSDLLPLVAAPTLVVTMPESPIPLNSVRKVAAGIPNAQLQTIEGKSVFVRYDSPDIEPWLNAFLTGEEASAASKAESVAPQGQEQAAFRVVLFTDLVGHTEMMQRLGDEGGREVLREHERITRNVLAAHGGTEIKADGDGFMMSFTSVARAVECAIALQRAFSARDGEPLSIRVGLNAGEPIAEEDDLFGATVILASRIAVQAGGGEILIPEPIRHLLSGKSFVFSDRGEFVPKGFDDAVRLFEVKWRDD